MKDEEETRSTIRPDDGQLFIILRRKANVGCFEAGSGFPEFATLRLRLTAGVI